MYDFKGGSRVLHLSTPLEHCTLREGSTCTVCSLQRVVPSTLLLASFPGPTEGLGTRLLCYQIDDVVFYTPNYKYLCTKCLVASIEVNTYYSMTVIYHAQYK